MRLLFAIAWAGLLRTRDSPCDCDCCAVSERMPSEVVNSFDLKCTMQPQDAGVCVDLSQGQMCTNLAPSRVIMTSAEVDYNRFCFFECKVPGGMAAELDQVCAALTDEEMVKVKAQSVSGNAVDLAAAGLDMGVVEGEDSAAATVEGVETVAETVTTTSTEPAGLDLANAAKTAAEAARTEARATNAEAKASAAAVNTAAEARKAHVSAIAATSSVASLRGNLVQAKIHARAAAAAAAETKKVLEELHTYANTAAVEVGRQAAAEVQAEADAAKRQLASMMAAASVPPPPEIPEAVGKVMGPYVAASLRAQGVKAAYSDQAQIWAGDAGAMRQQAKDMGNMANDYQAAGNTDAANKLLSDANGMFAKADSLGARTNEYQAIASKVNDGLPAYENARAMAGARAAYWANLPGMVPPPVAR